MPTPSIAEIIQAQMEHQRIWLERWPNYCHQCNGWGIVEWTENQAPLGSGQRWPEHFSEPCSCLESGKCPRCGEPDIEFTEFSDDTWADCRACGWTSRNPDALPVVLEPPEAPYEED